MNFSFSHNVQKLHKLFQYSFEDLSSHLASIMVFHYRRAINTNKLNEMRSTISL